MTVTLSAVAVAGVGETEGAGVGSEAELEDLIEAVGLETSSCAVAILVIRNNATKTVGNLFVKVFVFKVVSSCGLAIRRSRLKAAILHKCDRNSGEVA